MDQDKIDRFVEEICQRGCESVKRVIQALESNINVIEAAQLTPLEKRRALRYLKAILVVYQGAPELGPAPVSASAR